MSPRLAPHLKSMGVATPAEDQSAPHPYQREIEDLEYPSHALELGDEQKPGSLDDVKADTSLA